MEKKIISNLKDVLKIKKEIKYSVIKKCQLCFNKKFVSFSNTTLLKSDNIFVEFPFVQCLKCGLIQQKIKFSNSFHKYYYSKLYPKLLNRNKKTKNQLIENSYKRGKFLYEKLKKYLGSTVKQGLLTWNSNIKINVVNIRSPFWRLFMYLIK